MSVAKVRQSTHIHIYITYYIYIYTFINTFLYIHIYKSSVQIYISLAPTRCLNPGTNSSQYPQSTQMHIPTCSSTHKHTHAKVKHRCARQYLLCSAEYALNCNNKNAARKFLYTHTHTQKFIAVNLNTYLHAYKRIM